MYSNAEKQKRTSSKLTIFQLAQKVQDETQGLNQVAQIMKAYRKVQDIHAPPTNSNNQLRKPKETKPEPRKPESEYANKVKQTLRQLNANRKKQVEQNRELPKPVINEKIKGVGSAQRHLIQSGLRRLFKLMCKKYEQNIELAFNFMKCVGTKDFQQKEQKIRKWKLRRLFSGWQYEAMLCKIEKQRIMKEEIEKEKRQMRLAVDFNYFWTIKKSFKAWSLETLKKRQLQLEENLKRQQQFKRIEEEKKLQLEKQRKRDIKPNVQLQNKMRGFLEGLKQQIEGKDRLNTIKEKTQQSDQRRQEGDQSNIQQISHEGNITQNQQPQEEAVNEEGDNNNNAENQYHGPLTNQDLEKKRKQLEKKAKQRKQALQKLKNDRQQKKKQQLQQKLALEKEIEEEQKRIRQEQYRKFMKQKKEQQEWKEREKQLERLATQFDRLRLMKFYGWINWTKLKGQNQQRGEQIGNLLHKIVLKRRLQTFVNGINQIGQAKLKEAEEKAQKYFMKRLKKNCIKKLKQWKRDQLDLKIELQARHQVNTLKIFFKEWGRARNQIQLENYQWQRPRIKRAECLHAMTLMSKAFQSFKINKEQQIQNRNVQQHKAKIKQKVHKIVEEQPTINYDDFL